MFCGVKDWSLTKTILSVPSAGTASHTRIDVFAFHRDSDVLTRVQGRHTPSSPRTNPSSAVPGRVTARQPPWADGGRVGVGIDVVGVQPGPHGGRDGAGQHAAPVRDQALEAAGHAGRLRLACAVARVIHIPERKGPRAASQASGAGARRILGGWCGPSLRQLNRGLWAGAAVLVPDKIIFQFDSDTRILSDLAISIEASDRC